MAYWLRLDDAFDEHPKVIGLTDAAFRLEVAAICYAHRNTTDGLIPHGWPAHRLTRSIPALVDHRLWIPTTDGWLLNDYLSWQTSRATIEDQRKRMSEGGKRGAAARWHDRP